jgi:trigger factor
MGYDYNEVLENLKSSVEESTKTELILEAIADAENIQVDDGYDAFITDIYTKLGYTDIETFYKDYSVDGYDGQRYFELAYRTEKATDFLIENCVVNFVEADDTEVTDSAE